LEKNVINVYFKVIIGYAEL